MNQNRQQPVVLTIDDERYIRESFRDLLEDYDYTVFEAENGRVGLEVFRREEPDLILVDLRMPEVDGLDVLSVVTKESPDTPIIIVSGTGVISDVVEALRLGAWDYLLKPLEDLDVLRHAVEKGLERSRLIKENRAYQENLEVLIARRTAALEATNRELTVSEEKYRSLIETTAEGYVLMSADHRIVEANEAFLAISGYSLDEVLGMHFLDFPDESNKVNVQQHVERIEISPHRSYEFVLRARDGDAVNVLVSATAMHDDGEFSGWFAMLMDITDRKRMEGQIEYQALHDPLTGLANRMLCEERIARALERFRQRENYNYALFYLDLDRFKIINESLGHGYGDNVLIEIANRITGCVRELDTVARIGGDEFVVLLEELSNQRDAMRVLRAIRESLREPVSVGGQEVVLNASIGIVHCISGNTDAQEILRNAHVAMYQAKAGGGGRAKAFIPRMHGLATKILTLESDMDKGFVNSEFYPVYQPIFSLKDGSLYGFEVLARWNHPERGLVSPGEFIPIAEETGRIIDLGMYMLRKSCATMAMWRGQCENAENLMLAVNVSTKQLTQYNPVASIRRILEETGLPPDRLRLEITETALMQNAAKAINRLESIKSLGVTLSIDDFGTGYSSMSYLQQLPLDNLKIDLSFVRFMDVSPQNVEIVKAIITLAHSLGLECVAEGVEKEVHRDILKDLGCDYCQGFLLSKPLSAEDAFALMSDSACSIKV